MLRVALGLMLVPGCAPEKFNSSDKIRSEQIEDNTDDSLNNQNSLNPKKIAGDESGFNEEQNPDNSDGVVKVGDPIEQGSENRNPIGNSEEDLLERIKQEEDRLSNGRGNGSQQDNLEDSVPGEQNGNNPNEEGFNPNNPNNPNNPGKNSLLEKKSRLFKVCESTPSDEVPPCQLQQKLIWCEAGDSKASGCQLGAPVDKVTNTFRGSPCANINTSCYHKSTTFICVPNITFDQSTNEKC